MTVQRPTQTQALRIVTAEALRGHAARSLALTGEESTNFVTLECELLRAVVWGLTREGPVHINRLLNAVVDLRLAMSSDVQGDQTSSVEERARDELRRMLDVFAEAGDVVELDQGRWSPTAVRLVDVGAASVDRLVVGGIPSSVLPEQLRKTLTHRGALRFARGVEMERALGLRVVSLDSWIGAPSLPLRDWAQALLSSPLTPYFEPPERVELQVYAPGVKKRANQKERWADASASPDGRYLAKRLRVFGATERRVVEVRSGQVVASGNVLLPGEARRLMYAVDAFASRQVHAEAWQDADTFGLTLWSEVPSAERRLFSLIGALTAHEDRYYPRTWRFPRAWEVEVRRRLDALEINVHPRGEGQS